MERKVEIPAGPDGKTMDGFEVPIVESTERWTEIKLEDGAILRVKPSIISAIRIPGQWDQDGNPQYVLKATNAMMVAEADERYKRGASEVQTKKST